MRNLMKRRRAQSFFVKLCLAVFAVGAIAAYGKFGSVRGAYDAITGYLFPETYRFIDELTDKLKLNLKVYRATESAAWQEARYGKLWEQGVEGIEKYNDINKVEPMNRALKELNVQTWFAGLRREQSGSRANLPVLAIQRGVFKVLPIIDWDNRTIYQYLQKHGLKYHPLWDEGYLSVGDTHTTRKWEPGMAEEETRFFGLKRECGLHEG